MTEIRLQCPGCGTEYHLPAGSIPRDGRQVECTSCDQVWRAFDENHAFSEGISDEPHREDDVAGANNSGIIRHDLPKTLDQTDDAQSDSSPAAVARRIPESVLSILREEVEFERRARRGEITENSSEDSDQGLSPQYWPATTITTEDPAAGLRSIPAPSPQKNRSQDETASVVASGFEATRSETDSTAPVAGGSVSNREPAPSAKRPRKGAYVTGFVVAVGLAAMAVSLYIIAPSFPADGRFGHIMTEYRTIVDAGREWLAQQAGNLLPAD